VGLVLGCVALHRFGLAVADGALGFWQAIEEVWPTTRGQRCWKIVPCGPYPTARPRGPLDRGAQVPDRKYCRPHARPFRLGFPRKVPVFPICPPAAL
jgi:hypothetical protein